MRYRLVAAVAGVCAALLPAAPAWAHDKVPAASDYRTTLETVTPKPRGLSVRVVENGSRIEVRNGTGGDVTVIGYSGEPYLRITPDAVFTNLRSPTGYVNEKKTIPADADAKAAPDWRRTGDGGSARWHDHRSHWTGTSPPPAAQDEPDRQHRIRDWTVPLLAGATSVAVTGTLDYAPPPATSVWWAAILALAGVMFLVGRWRHGIPLLGAGLAVAAVAELVDSVGRVIDSGGGVVTLLVTETYGTFAAIGALAAAVTALRRLPVAPFALALAAAVLGVLGGITDAAVFNQAFAPTPWSGDVARACTAATIGICAGVTLTCWLRIRAVRRTASPPVQA